ncbi:MAG: Rne/Rng family ribonuclease [Planctomycetes bacterium]|nr:Rne/Rng family ribonuclease [Planctomycetota bacterium]
MSRVLLLDVADAEERRAALLENGAPSLFWVERDDERSLVGNVYLGRVVRVEPSIGAAFVDLGLDRPGFLPADDAAFREVRDEVAAAVPEGGADATAAPAEVDAIAPGDATSDVGAVGVADPRRIVDMLRTGDSIIVQVARDAVARKGPTLTTFISYAGRTIVVLPGLGRIAVSRKLDDPAVRSSIEERIGRLGLPPGLGVVARTACAEATDEEMADDAARLLAAHRCVETARASARAPALLHEEDDFITRAVRELSVRAPEGAAGPLRIVVNSADAEARAIALTARMSPGPEIVLHAEGPPLFHAFGVERELRALDEPRVALVGGATIVIHETEAMWTIDVNSGRLRTADSLEETALATDLLAAKEVARQIRLRDLSGLIVIDFIDCRDEANRQKVEAAVRAELAKDPAKMRVAPLSEFMVCEITRRRLRSGAARSGAHVCPSCGGRGRIRSARSAGLAAIRDVRALLADGAPRGVDVTAAPAVAAELDRRRPEIVLLEQRHSSRVHVHRSPQFDGDRFEVRRK